MKGAEFNARFIVGLDLGQRQDYTALAVVEDLGELLTVRHLHRYPLGTPYPEIVDDVAALVGREPLTVRGTVYDPRTRRDTHPVVTVPLLVVDGTGVGAAITDLFRKRAALSADLRSVIITGGDTVTRDGRVFRVPKRDLVAAVQVPLQNRELKIVPTLREAVTLQRELENFRVKISLATAHDSYGEWREGEHDDLVLSVALALYFARVGPSVGRLRALERTLRARTRSVVEGGLGER